MCEPWETDDTRMARANLAGCAYNAAVNFGTPRGFRKMGDLIRAINLDERTTGEAKLKHLVRLGVIESFKPCPSECEMRPGGLFHAKECENDGNHPVYKARQQRAMEMLPGGPDGHGGWRAAMVHLVGARS